MGRKQTATLKVGQTVTIYEYPLTQEHPEGRAKLMRYIGSMPDMEVWEVRFPDGDIVTRKIAPEARNA